MAASVRAHAFKSTNHPIGQNEYVTRGAVIKGLLERTHKLSSFGNKSVIEMNHSQEFLEIFNCGNSVGESYF